MQRQFKVLLGKAFPYQYYSNTSAAFVFHFNYLKSIVAITVKDPCLPDQTPLFIYLDLLIANFVYFKFIGCCDNYFQMF